MFSHPLRLFPEFALAFVSFGFLIATLVCAAKDGVTQSNTLIFLLIIISSLSGIAGCTRYHADKSIDRLCAACEIGSDNEEGSVKDIELHPSYYNNPYFDRSPDRNAHFKGLELIPSHDQSVDGASSVCGDTNRNQFLRWTAIVKSFLRPSVTTLMFLHGPACVLHLNLIVRLFAVENFQTHPINLDFGPKYGYIDESDGSFVSNIAFEADYSSFGHALQGFLTSFLSFPAFSGWLARRIGTIDSHKRVDFHVANTVVSVTTLVYSLCTIYPTYISIKMMKNNSRTFTSTSFVNDAMEWTMGYVLGLSLGMLWTNLMRKALAVIYPLKHEGGLDAFMETFDVGDNGACQTILYGREGFENESDKSGNTPVTSSTKYATTNASKHNKQYAFGKPEEFASNMSLSEYCSRPWDTILFNVYHVECTTIINVMSKIFLALFNISVLLCSVYMGATWNNCLEENSNECINSTTNGVAMGHRLTVFFLCSFVIIQMGFFIASKCFFCNR